VTNLVRKQCLEALTKKLDTAQLDTTLQTHFVLLSRDQHSSHKQVHNPTTLKSTRMCTPMTLGLCYLLQCSIVKDHRRNGIACLWLWGCIEIPKKKIDVRARGFHVNTYIRKRNQWTLRRQRMRNEEARSREYENHEMQKNLWNCFGKCMNLLKVKVHYHEIEVCHMSGWFKRIMI
jgi:hypothetical protein